MTSTSPAPKKTKHDKIGVEEYVLLYVLENAVNKDGIKPSNLIRTTCVNVFGNKWRVNLWEGINNPVVPNAGRIVKSYFVKCGDKGLEILED